MKAFIDCHVHLRDGMMSTQVIPYSAKCCDHIIAMPNINPPIHDLDRIQSIKEFYQSIAGPDCQVHLTTKLLPTTTPEDVELNAQDIIGYKLYPAYSTSNSNDGIPARWLDNPTAHFLDTIAAIEQHNLVLLHHGEHPSAFVMDREYEYLRFMANLRKTFPKLRMTLEHITTINGVQFVINNPLMLGTITLHHLYYTLDDLIGDKLQPHLFCKPVYKYPIDRDALLKAINLPNFALGSDSAPWYSHDKIEGCAGVFSAPVLAEGMKLVDASDSFTSGNAAEFYNLPLPTNELVFEETERYIPKLINNIPVLFGDQRLPFRFKGKVPCPQST